VIVAVSYLSWRPTLERWAAGLTALAGKPFRMWLVWYLLGFCLFMPMVLIFGGSAWIGIGPFAFQLSRILLYFLI